MSMVIWTGPWDDFFESNPNRKSLYCEADQGQVAKGYASLPMLQFLNGQPWDAFAFGLVHSLRPFMLRVVCGCEHTDSWPWRVTVRLENDGQTIREIVQEVEVCGGSGNDIYKEMEKRGIRA